MNFVLHTCGRALRSRLGRLLAAFSVAALLATPSRAIACGGEVPTSCDDEADDARYLLKLAVIAVQHDEPAALTWFTQQAHGFRTQDLYVFCIGPDNIMDAHPDPKIRGLDARTLADQNGFHFGAEMIKSATAGKISDITYMWPRLEGSKPYVKHTMYTRVADQICAVGYYE